MSTDYLASINFNDADFNFDDSFCPDIEAMAESYCNTQEVIAASNADRDQNAAADASASAACINAGVPP